MLAYHSVEHMGLIALGAAAGSPLAIAAVLLHILGHGIAKGVLFLASGEILLVEGTSEIEHVPALLADGRSSEGIFAFGLVALLGFPPFSLFVSELNMLRAEFSAGLGWAAGLSLLCMAVIFGAVMSHGRHMLFGSKGSDAPATTPALVAVPLIGGLVGCAFIGVLGVAARLAAARRGPRGGAVSVAASLAELLERSGSAAGVGRRSTATI